MSVSLFVLVLQLLVVAAVTEARWVWGAKASYTRRWVVPCAAVLLVSILVFCHLEVPMSAVRAARSAMTVYLLEDLLFSCSFVLRGRTQFALEPRGRPRTISNNTLEETL